MLEIEYHLKPRTERRSTSFRPSAPLPFGKLRSDHMFVMEYNEGTWHSPKIVPYGPLTISPGAIALNYGQEIFEGSKAFEHDDRDIYLFRIDQHAQRFQNSAELICMPPLPANYFTEGIEALVDVDRLWFPQQEGASLYIRPVMIALEDCLGVRESSSYLFYVMLSPSGPYYAKGFDPIRLLITDKFHRAAPGGTGQAKTAGNYAASLRAKHYAAQFDAQQVLYLDVSTQYIEEAGAMNHYQVSKEGIVTIPTFTDTILKSVTSCSMLELSSQLGFKVQQEQISLDSFLEGIKSKTIIEAGGLGTAAVVSPVGGYTVETQRHATEELRVGNGKAGRISTRMYELLRGIQMGKEEAPQGWLRKVKKS